MLAELTGKVALVALRVDVARVREIAEQESRARQQHYEPDGSCKSAGFGERRRHDGGCGLAIWSEHYTEDSGGAIVTICSHPISATPIKMPAPQGSC